MYKQITIKTLNNQGKKKTEIAQDVGCHRNTVRNILLRDNFIDKQTREKSSYFDQFKSHIQNWLTLKYSRLRIYEILQEEYGLDRTYDSMCKYVQKNFPTTKEAFGVQNTLPGEEAEIDFGYLGMYPNDSNTRSKVFVLAVTLSFSRKVYYELLHDQKIAGLIKGSINAFNYFKGVPLKIKVDNMKTAILKNRQYDLEFNQDFLEFAYHYGFTIKPCTPYKPNQKGKVESSVKYIQNNFVVGRTFDNFQDMKMQLKKWQDNYANKRIHGTTKKIPEEIFQQYEKTKLQLFPENEFVLFNTSTRTVKTNCHISFHDNYYSVPAEYITKELVIRWSEQILRVFAGVNEVALHKINNKTRGEYVTVRSHLPDYKCYSDTEYQAKYEMKMDEIGEYAHQYFAYLIKARDGYWYRTVRTILGLSHEYGNERINLSLKRALRFNVYDLMTIKNICKKQTYLIDDAPKFLEVANTESSLARNMEYYQQVYTSI